MTWSLNLDLKKTPLVIAGPILRKVTFTSATVWFVLQKPATIRLSVRDKDGEIFFGSRKTYAIGRNLHMVAVTANQLGAFRKPGEQMASGVVYTYDALFDVAGEPRRNLLEAINVEGSTQVTLGYDPFGAPTFCLPPSDPNKLRLIHGSCRHPNGIEGKDALAILGGLIGETALDPERRPHQLFLTGDQIYADDVAASLLQMLTAASDQLLGWKETLPIPKPFGDPRPGSRVVAYSRKAIAEKAGLTSDQADNHLFSLGEYICMYLFVWSDVLWSDSNIPTEDDVAEWYASQFDPKPHLEQPVPHYVKPETADNNRYLHQFRKYVPEIRRTLANISVYMILDDHEITDDFHLCKKFCEDVYGNELGKLVIQNGLTAYALCQHWGNAPESFFDLPSKPPGLRLLEKLNNGNADTYRSQANELAKLVGVHDAATLKAHADAQFGERKGVLALYHDPDTLIFDYVVDFPSHQVIVTDSRTWRLFPNGPREAGQLMPKEQVVRQVAKAKPDSADRPTFIVLSTNAPASRIIRYGEHHPWRTRVKYSLDNDPEPDLWDSWELPSPSLDRLIVGMSERVALLKDQAVGSVRRGSVIVLSGDVHSSYASRTLFSGTARFEDTTNQPVNMVIAQLVSSSLRNQTPDTLNQDKNGHAYPHFLLGDTRPEGYAGWNLPTGTTKQVGVNRGKPLPPPADISPEWPLRITGPATIGRDHLGPRGNITEQPDYGYRFDYIPANQEHPIPNFAKDPLPKPIDAKASADKFRKITANYRDYLTADHPKRDIVGVTNISEVTLSWDKNDDRKRTVHHTVRWFGGKAGETVMLTTFSVSLNPDDDRYKMSDVMKTLGWTKPLAWAP